MSQLRKKKLGLFSLTSCGGCLYEIGNLGQVQLELEKFFDIFDLRDKSDFDISRFDIALIEGNPDTEGQIDLLRKIRRRSDKVIIVGACSDLGGVQSIRNSIPKKLINKDRARSASEIVRVDFLVPGCPPTTSELLEVVMDTYWGKTHHLPDLAVCFECRKNENECRIKDNKICLGPITRAGCNSICVNQGEACLGCRGLKNEPNIKRLKQVLLPMSQAEDTKKLLNIFGSIDE